MKPAPTCGRCGCPLKRGYFVCDACRVRVVGLFLRDLSADLLKWARRRPAR
jgi:hypothetical protein